MTKKLKIIAMFMAVLLASIAFVPAVTAQADGLSSVSSDQKGKKIIEKTPEFKEIEFTDTTTIVQVGDMLISFESNSNYTEAKMELKNLTTNEVTTFNYEVSQEAGKYKTDVYIEGKLVNTVTSEYNPIKPGETSKILEKPSSQTNLSRGTTLYDWDGVTFIKGSGIKYNHPDYTTYDAYDYEAFYIDGDVLTHHHINKYDSAAIAQCAPIVAGATIGYYVGNIVGGVAGGLLAAMLTSQTSEALLDEQDCIWYWESDTWAPVYLAGMWRTVPLYFRVSSYTLWNSLDISNP
ncbi:hypothetical protein EO98_05340 [Methanosarcina sp. 2.H.T.1A.6]|uniref:hypothetical protein n=1 Tax=unclassified Methanosarcina TaxID=2644672 RepID=UPI0006221C96|nr:MULTISPECIES: hypothetical protein [unclassified Methanosarcina]KKG13535.1 hypothetical protein EO94_02085 [Methanosarcina sp. 2.H.T.1A.3]KKG15131.1 hypothetical protein EO97_17995 [Methanosarcina sp. 2.H.T.1A.15]KKG24827.1 hypothetical protein EO98_05340 [Methanosarcina sp. 2.H.T.1A.6]KKG26055.1 hypothetical protein EO96_16255 [Methanosarcina sp. 2.H.T.1A.8]